MSDPLNDLDGLRIALERATANPDRHIHVRESLEKSLQECPDDLLLALLKLTRGVKREWNSCEAIRRSVGKHTGPLGDLENGAWELSLLLTGREVPKPPPIELESDL